MEGVERRGIIFSWRGFVRGKRMSFFGPCFVASNRVAAIKGRTGG